MLICWYAGPLYDIRSPLGVSPAALRALKANPTYTPTGLHPSKEQGFNAYQSFRKTRANLLTTQNKKRLKAVAVDFRRVWWDKGVRGNSREGGGIWRPVPPPGYVSLGEVSISRVWIASGYLLTVGSACLAHQPVFSRTWTVPSLLAAYFCDCACITCSSMCFMVAKLQTKIRRNA